MNENQQETAPQKPKAFSETEAYARVVDRLNIAVLRQRKRSDIFKRLRPLLREEGFGAKNNPFAQYAFDDLVQMASKVHPEIAKEVRRQILAYPRPHQYKTWLKMDRICPATEAEIRKAAKHGLVTPYIVGLKEKPIPAWLRKPSTVACLFVNKPEWLDRIEEALGGEGCYYLDILKEMLNRAVRENNMPLVEVVLRHWPKGNPIPYVHPESMEMANKLLAFNPDGVSPAVMAELHYKNGDRKAAAKVIAALPMDHTDHSWLWRIGAEKSDLDWVVACGNNANSRYEILTGMMDYGRYQKPKSQSPYLHLVLKLLRRHEWKALFRRNEPEYLIEHSFAVHDETVRAIAMQEAGCYERNYRGPLCYDRAYLPEFLRQRPTEHDFDFWRALKPREVRELALLATRFSDESAMEILRKAGSSIKHVRHALANSTAKFDVPDIFGLPDRAVKEILAAKRLNEEFHWHSYGLKDTKLKLSTLKKLIGPKTPWASKISVDNEIPYYMRAATLLTLAGHTPKSLQAFVKEASSEFVDPSLLAEMTQIIKPAIPTLTDAQLCAFLSAKTETANELREAAVAEMQKRAESRPPGPATIRALLNSPRIDLFIKYRPASFIPNLKDMVRLVELEQWETLKTIRQEQAEWQKPSDELYPRVDRKHWEKLVELGFRITTDCYHRPAVQFFMDHSLFTLEELNQIAINAENNGFLDLAPKIYPAPTGVQGHVIDIYNQGRFSHRHLERFIRDGRSHAQNLASIQQGLRRLQKTASPSRRICVLEYAEEEDRWGLLGLTPPIDTLKEMNPYGFSLSNFKPVLGALLHEALRTSTDPTQVLKPAYNLSVAFGNLTEIRKILHKRNLPSKTPLHDLGQFSLPAKGTWDIGGWRQLLQHHSGRGLNLIKLAPRIEAQLGRLPKNMDEAEEMAVKASYARNAENLALAKFCYEYSQDEDYFEDYLKLMEDAKDTDNCPDILLNGDSLGDPNLVFRRLQPKDPIGPLLGEVTDCCQHLGGHAAECAKAGAIEPDASFYVLERKGAVIAQCFAWKTDDHLVFDSWQGLGSTYNHFCLPVLTAAATKALEMDPKLTDVRLGTGGGTPALELTRAKPCRWKRRLQGMDSSSQYLLAKRGEVPLQQPEPERLAA
jgi:hypothetical protein